MGYLSCKAQSSISTVDSHAAGKGEPVKIQEFSYTDLELATGNFSDDRLLGRGSHGLVYKGVLHGGRQVAIKKPSHKTLLVSQNTGEFDNEIGILSGIHSPRFVNLVGFSRADPPRTDCLLVVEFMSNGTLYDALHSSHRPPNWGRRIRLAFQTARAVHTLHSLSPPVIHRDIKSANVLIDRNFNARLGDFGLALRCTDDSRLKSTPPAGTMGYLDPGYVTPDGLSTKADVFSFGILLMEIISGRKAIDLAHSPPSIVDWAVPLIRRGRLLSVYDPRVPPPSDAAVRRTLAVVAAKCVRSCRERRPSMGEVAECLAEMSQLVPVSSWSDFAINPCLAVEEVGRPVRTRGWNFGDDEGKIGKGGRNPRRVYSDLGHRSNLMDLMSAGHKGLPVYSPADDRGRSLRKG